MGISNTFLACALAALGAGSLARATDFPVLEPGQIMKVGDRLVCMGSRDVVADLEPDQSMPRSIGGPRLTVHIRKLLRTASPPIVDIALDGETFFLEMSPEGSLFLYSRLEGRPDQEIWRNPFEDGKWPIPGSRLILGPDGSLELRAPDGRLTWRAFYP